MTRIQQEEHRCFGCSKELLEFGPKDASDSSGGSVRDLMVMDKQSKICVLCSTKAMTIWKC